MHETARSVTFRQLAYLVAVAQAESFTAAARLMKVSQPALSSHLRLMESVLGVALFRSEKRRVLLTPAGMAVAEFARHIEDEFLVLLMDIHASLEIRLGRLNEAKRTQKGGRGKGQKKAGRSGEKVSRASKVLRETAAGSQMVQLGRKALVM